MTSHRPQHQQQQASSCLGGRVLRGSGDANSVATATRQATVRVRACVRWRGGRQVARCSARITQRFTVYARTTRVVARPPPTEHCSEVIITMRRREKVRRPPGQSRRGAVDCTEEERRKKKKNLFAVNNDNNACSCSTQLIYGGLPERQLPIRCWPP